MTTFSHGITSTSLRDTKSLRDINSLRDKEQEVKQVVPADWPSVTGLSDRSSSERAADERPLSTITGGDADRFLLLERMLDTRLSSFVWRLKLIRPQVTSWEEKRKCVNYKFRDVYPL